MKKITIKAAACLSLLLFAQGPTTAATSADSRYVYPTRSFDPIAAFVGLEPGTATLRGHTVSGTFADSNVAIYPVTEYFQEYLDLRDKLESDVGHSAGLDYRTYSVRRVTQASDHHFEFANLKPGKYYVESPPYYVRGEDPEMDKFVDSVDCVYFERSRATCVEIQADGQVAEVEL